MSRIYNPPINVGSFGWRLRSARARAGLARHDLADMVGFSYMTIERYETGKRSPTLDKMKSLAVALDVSLAWLVTGEGPETGGRS